MLLKNWIIILKLLVCLYNVQFSLLIEIVMHNFYLMNSLDKPITSLLIFVMQLLTILKSDSFCRQFILTAITFR
nr:MAG TPA: hypothetical protein [Caudoviricetes sp.]